MHMQWRTQHRKLRGLVHLILPLFLLLLLLPLFFLLSFLLPLLDSCQKFGRWGGGEGLGGPMGFSRPVGGAGTPLAPYRYAPTHM